MDCLVVWQSMSLKNKIKEPDEITFKCNSWTQHFLPVTPPLLSEASNKCVCFKYLLIRNYIRCLTVIIPFGSLIACFTHGKVFYMAKDQIYFDHRNIPKTRLKMEHFMVYSANVCCIIEAEWMITSGGQYPSHFLCSTAGAGKLQPKGPWLVFVQLCELRMFVVFRFCFVFYF